MINPDDPAGAELTRRVIAEKVGCITQEELRIFMDIAPSTEEAKRKRGDSPPYAVVGNTILYPIDTLEAYVKARVKARGVRPKDLL